MSSNTTMAVRKTTYAKLLKIKHDLEDQKGKTVNFSMVIEQLIQRWETT